MFPEVMTGRHFHAVVPVPQVNAVGVEFEYLVVLQMIFHLERPDELDDFSPDAAVFAGQKVAGQLLRHRAVAGAFSRPQAGSSCQVAECRFAEFEDDVRQSIGGRPVELVVLAGDNRVEKIFRNILAAVIQAVVVAVADQPQPDEGSAIALCRDCRLLDMIVNRARNLPGLVGIGQSEPDVEDRHGGCRYRKGQEGGGVAEPPFHPPGRAGGAGRALAFLRGNRPGPAARCAGRFPGGLATVSQEEPDCSLPERQVGWLGAALARQCVEALQAPVAARFDRQGCDLPEERGEGQRQQRRQNDERVQRIGEQGRRQHRRRQVRQQHRRKQLGGRLRAPVVMVEGTAAPCQGAHKGDRYQAQRACCGVDGRRFEPAFHCPAGTGP